MNSPDVEHTKTEMKNNVIDFIEELIKSLREEKKGSSWPQLQAINVNASSLSFKDLWPENNQETFVIVERADSYIGKEVLRQTLYGSFSFFWFPGDFVNLEEEQRSCC